MRSVVKADQRLQQAQLKLKAQDCIRQLTMGACGVSKANLRCSQLHCLLTQCDVLVLLPPVRLRERIESAAEEEDGNIF